MTGPVGEKTATHWALANAQLELKGSELRSLMTTFRSMMTTCYMRIGWNTHIHEQLKTMLFTRLTWTIKNYVIYSSWFISAISCRTYDFFLPLSSIIRSIRIPFSSLITVLLSSSASSVLSVDSVVENSTSGI